MKKLAPCKQAEAMKWLFNNPGSKIQEREKPKKKKSSIPKMAWYAGSSDIDLTDKAVNSMEEKEWIVVDGIVGGYILTENGRALAEMMVGQKVFDFKQGIFKHVKSYDIDPYLQTIDT